MHVAGRWYYGLAWWGLYAELLSYLPVWSIWSERFAGVK